MVAVALKETYAGHSRVLDVAEVDPSGDLAAMLGCRGDDVWLIRPDAHIAAALSRPTSAEIRQAARRAVCGVAT